MNEWHNLYKAANLNLPSAEDLTNLLYLWYAKYEHLRDVIIENFGPNGFVVLVLFALFLLAIIIIYAKSVADTFGLGKKAEQNSAAKPTDTACAPEDEIVESANDNEPETPLYNSQEKEQLEKERELSADLVRASQETDDILNLKKGYGELKEKMLKHARDENIRLQKTVQEIQPAAAQNDVPTGRIEDFVALVLNLLGRGVNEAKIIQALYHYYKTSFKEEDVFQIVRAVRDFLGLCNAGKFDPLPDKNQLPPLQDAICALARGQAKQCLILLQSLLNYQMDLADSETGIIQDLNYAIAANYACLMGNLARLNDIELAHNSFELATELAPKNVRAWNRLGDMYMLKDTPEKALIAFQNVLDIGDEILYAAQIADAQQYLSTYFQNMGLTAKAAEMREASNRFYEASGIRTPLSSVENIVFQTILNNSAENTPIAVAALLSARNH